MKKEKRNILILSFVIILVIIFSYLMFISGTTNKLKASINRQKKFNKDVNASFYPVIKMVINSSGESLVNSDVALNIIGESIYNIDKVYYSYDGKKWYDNYYSFSSGKKANIKLVFKKSMNKKVYIKIENEMGYQSYPYETTINIDKEKPEIKINTNDILVSDNYDLSSILLSNDNVNFEEIKISGKKYTLNINEINYNYIKAVDKAGNISELKKVK